MRLKKSLNLNKTATLMHQALDLDSTNVDAQNILDEIKLNNYQKIVDKATGIFNRAQSRNDVNLYFDALTQIRKAQAMGGTTPELRRMLSRIYGKTLGVLNFEDHLALAVLKEEYVGGKMIFSLVVRNYLPYAVTLSFDNFVLSDYRGNQYNVDKEIMTRDYNMSGIKQLALNHGEDMGGFLVFTVPDSVSFDYIGYRYGAGSLSKKYFP